MPKSITTFISYPRALEHVAAEVAGQLRTNGYSVWIDVNNFDKAADAHSQLKKAIEGCDYFLSISPRVGRQSYWVRFENAIAAQTCTVLADSYFFRGNQLEVWRKEDVGAEHPDAVILSSLKQIEATSARTP
ncbi:toll/interleukin-1 receptor domain-containing protein [Streptomyces prunicolor]|uniref:Toll/interleukin-1 receptor domain-containing protein n=1 Tax=Streptomyces prunicolor TaxID=67348 RepID=A0ABU4F5U4_9ACTN|nr:toll/interleukin-1 receptor domain-containing protein [Streptomyces prunicolor]MDV7215393.1 toll/interleukin-1 receptor domain-containing protein [Streptomyces prunicolor]